MYGQKGDHLASVDLEIMGVGKRKIGEFQDSMIMKLPAIYKAYVFGLWFRGYTPKIWPYATVAPFQDPGSPIDQPQIPTDGGWL